MHRGNFVTYSFTYFNAEGRVSGWCLVLQNMGDEYRQDLEAIKFFYNKYPDCQISGFIKNYYNDNE